MANGTLILSLYGPFVYLFEKDPIEIYAADCAGHYAGIAGTENEAPLGDDKHKLPGLQYEIPADKIIKNAGPISFVNIPTILSVPAGTPLDTSSVYFSLKLPRPKIAAGIGRSESISVTATKMLAPTKTGPQPWATAMRLVYDCELDPSGALSCDVQKDGDLIKRLTSRDYAQTGQVDLSVDYFGTPDPATSIEDAKECFDALQSLMSIGWELDIPKPKSIDGGASGRPGTGCRAPVMMSH